MSRLKIALNQALSILFLETIALFLIVSFRIINLESALVLFVFDFLFVSLAFQLAGTFTKKLGLLALSNIVGFFCNLVFHSFHIVGVEYFGDLFNGFFAISYPLLNMVWMVSFWSLSLAILPKPKNMKVKMKS